MLIKQSWKLIADTIDLITYETSLNGLAVRIEARKREDNSWIIFKTYLDQKYVGFTEEYNAKTRNEAKHIIAVLQKEKILTKDEIDNRRLYHAKKAKIHVKRIFKDYNVEKWVFSVNGSDYENTLFIRDGDIIEATIIMPEINRSLEINIINELHAILGLKISDFDLKQEIYYYTTRSDDYIKSKKEGILFGKLEMGFDMMNDE